MIAFVIAGTLIALVLYGMSGKHHVTPTEAKTLIKTGKVKKVVDVRTALEYKAGHYPGAIHIPVTAISKKTTQGLPMKGLLVYCNTGQRARIAAEKLDALGFEDVYFIDGTYKTLM